VAPVSAQIYDLMKVHLFGFSSMLDHSSFVVPGEVMSVLPGSFQVISNPSTPGLSGSVIVWDNGGVIGYLGGAPIVADRSPFGAYAYLLNYVFMSVQKADDSKKSSSGDEDSQST